MPADRAQLCAQLRCAVDSDDLSPTQQALYEAWLSRDRWQLVEEAVPLIVGVGPDTWPQYVLQHELDQESAMFAAILAEDFGCQLDGAIDATDLRDWSRRTGIALPSACDRLLDYIASVLPATPVPAPAAEQQAAAAEREVVLGAALALVTRFPAQCRDDNGFFDGQRIAGLMLEKAALWFPLEPPSMDRDAIAALLEGYLT